MYVGQFLDIVFRDHIRDDPAAPLEIALDAGARLDVSGLGINDSLTIDQLRMPEGVKAVTHGEHFAVVGLVPPVGAEETKAAE